MYAHCVTVYYYNMYEGNIAYDTHTVHIHTAVYLSPGWHSRALTLDCLASRRCLSAYVNTQFASLDC